MYDFLQVKKEFLAKKQRYVYKPAFVIKSKIKDLMIRGRDFYALWDEGVGLWTTDEGVALELIDRQVREEVEKQCGPELMNDPEHGPIIQTLRDADTGLIDKWHKFCQKDLRDNYIAVNQKVKFSNSEIKREDYATFKLDYPLQEMPIPYYEKLVSTLYPDTEREKFEWAVGCILAGDQKKIQKLFVFYGEPGSGKSTVINKIIVNTVFGGTKHAPYCTKFTAGLLTGRDSFGTGFLASDPVVAFDDDADLSRIEDNTTLNLIVSHEAVRVNEKFARPFTAYPNCILLCGTNEPVSLSPNSGLNRRLIDIRQTGDKVTPDEYDDIIDHLPFEKSGIAYHCLQVYKKLGKNYYNHYMPEDMLSMTSPFHNFCKDNYIELRDGITLAAAYKLYCDYAQESNYKTIMTRYKFRDQLKLYFDEYGDHTTITGDVVKSFFSGFKADKIGIQTKQEIVIPKSESWLKFDAQGSLFDALYSDMPAQYANENGTPAKAWDKVKTTLETLNTKKLHYVKVPINVIVIDFDIKDENGEKSLEKNMAAASKFPPTYAELSKSGSGIHLHYIYTGGDPQELSRVYGDNIEIKVFAGNAALRRQLTKCNQIPIAEICNLPTKEGGTSVVNWEGVQNEKHLRAIIVKDLRKEVFPGTKPSVDHINDILKDSYRKGMRYDISDMYDSVLAFGMNSTHKAQYCVNLINRMHFKGRPNELEESEPVIPDDPTAPIIFLDCEIYPNLFLINWKFEGKGKTVTRMINPTPEAVRDLFKYRIIAFNGRDYDAHVLWARAMGYSVEELFNLSQRIINEHTGQFPQAYSLCYADPLDYASAGNKQSLKKWEIQLGITHMEMSIPWDQPVPEEQWDAVAAYCDNDVISLEAVHNYLHSDFVAREILAAMSGLNIIDKTNKHTVTLLTNGIKDPQSQFVYTNLGEMKWPNGDFIFPGYEFNKFGIDPKRYKEGVKIVSGKSIYKGIDPGEGGRKIAYPGYYEWVWLFDVASMHPHSAIKLNIFGGVITKRFENIVEARVAIKHGNYEKALELLSSFVDRKVLEPYLTGDPETLKKSAKALANALKTAINSVYGLTSASFDNKLRDPRNEDNIIAKYGALFMINLQEEIEKKGYTVVHVSTDSIKVANCDNKLAEFIMDFGKKYGYTFELEAKYEKMCIVNDAVYIAKEAEEDGKWLKPEERFWTATGKQFQVPYVFKSLFSHEEIIFDDMCETNSVKDGAIFLDYNENLPDVTFWENLSEWRKDNPEKLTKKAQGLLTEYESYSDEQIALEIARGHNQEFIGRVGRFTPIKPGCGGAELIRSTTNGKKPYAAVAGTKGYRWLESETVKANNKEFCIDRSYYQKLCDDAMEAINKFVDFDYFVSDFTVSVPADAPEVVEVAA